MKNGNNLKDSEEFISILNIYVNKLFSNKDDTLFKLLSIDIFYYNFKKFTIFSNLENIVYYKHKTPIIYNKKSLTHSQMFELIKEKEKNILRELKLKRIIDNDI